MYRPGHKSEKILTDHITSLPIEVKKRELTLLNLQGTWLYNASDFKKINAMSGLYDYIGKVMEADSEERIEEKYSTIENTLGAAFGFSTHKLGWLSGTFSSIKLVGSTLSIGVLGWFGLKKLRTGRRSWISSTTAHLKPITR